MGRRTYLVIGRDEFIEFDLGFGLRAHVQNAPFAGVDHDALAFGERLRRIEYPDCFVLIDDFDAGRSHCDFWRSRRLDHINASHEEALVRLWLDNYLALLG